MHEAPAFQVLSLIVTLFVLGVLSANLYYFNKIYQAGGTDAVSSSEAVAMLWVNGIILFFLALMVVWGLVKAALATQTGARYAAMAMDPQRSLLSRRAQ